MAKKDFKKELSKELMYKKIMPSSSRTESSDRTPSSYEPASVSTSPSSIQSPSLTTLPQIEEQNDLTDTAAIKQTPAAVQPGPVLMNLMEYLVAQRVDEVMKKFNCCNCVKCKKDAIALALNKLPPKYIVKTNDVADDYIKNKSAAEVLTALIQAVLVVRSNPRHSETDEKMS